MSLVPLFIVITAISSIFISDYHQIVDLMKDFFPNITSKFISVINYLSEKRTVFGILGFIVAFYFSNSIFTSLHTAMVYIFEDVKVSLKKTAFIYIFGVPIFITILIIIYIALMFLSSVVDILSNSAVWKYLEVFLSFFDLDWVLKYITDISQISSFIMFYSVLFAIYYYLSPLQEKNLKYILWTSFFISIFLVILKVGFNYYIIFASKANPVYGSLSGIFAFLAWLYLSYSFILIGGRIVYYLHKETN